METTDQSVVLAARPKLDEWLRARRISVADAARRLNISREAVRKYCLPFEDGRRAVPSEEIMVRIAQLTERAILAGDFYPPHLREPGSPQPAEAARP